MQITRDEARKHLLRGWPVTFNGQTLSPSRRTDGRFAEPQLPPEHAGGDYQACRHPTGFTRAGLANIIDNGGGVLMNGQVITSLDELPPEEVLAGGDADLLRQIHAQQEEELGRLLQTKEETRRRLQEAEQRTLANPPPAAKTGPAPRIQVAGTAPQPHAEPKPGAEPPKPPKKG